MISYPPLTLPVSQTGRLSICHAAEIVAQVIQDTRLSRARSTAVAAGLSVRRQRPSCSFQRPPPAILSLGVTVRQHGLEGRGEEGSQPRYEHEGSSADHFATRRKPLVARANCLLSSGGKVWHVDAAHEGVCVGLSCCEHVEGILCCGGHLSRCPITSGVGNVSCGWFNGGLIGPP